MGFSVHDARVVDKSLEKLISDCKLGTVSLPRRISSSGLLPFVATSAIAGAILAILAPYNTTQFAFLHRLLFWVGLCFAGGIGAACGNFLLDRLSQNPPGWVCALTQSLGATLLVFTCFWLLHTVTQGVPTGLFYVLVPFYIWVIAILISGFGVLLHSRAGGTPVADQRPAIFERLKPALRSADIYALTSEDHYVRVITSKGDDLILMRLSDAMKDVIPTPGLHVHRSWWVAEIGVKSVKKDNGKIQITLKNDATVPVSRSNTKSVRDAGWV